MRRRSPAPVGVVLRGRDLGPPQPASRHPGRLRAARALLAENLVLRQQLIVLRRGVARPRLRCCDRWLIAALAGRFRSLGEAVIVVKPETVIA